VAVVVVVELEIEVVKLEVVAERVDTLVAVYEKLVDDVNGGVETHPLMPQVVAPKAKFDGELEAIRAPRIPTTNTKAIARLRAFKFK